MIDLMKIPTNNEEKEKYLNHLNNLDEVDDINQLLTSNYDIDIIKALLRLRKESDGIVALNPLYSIHVIKLFIDNDVSIYNSYFLVDEEFEYDKHYLLEIFAYIVNRGKSNDTYLSFSYVVLTEDDFNVILDLIDMYSLKDKINIFISTLLCHFSVDLSLFNRFHEIFKIEFNYSFTQRYPLISQRNYETIERMMSLNYKFKTKILNFGQVYDLEKFKLYIEYAEKNNCFISSDVIINSSFKTVEEFEEMLKYYSSKRHMFLKNNNKTVFSQYFMKYIEVENLIEILKLLLKYGFLPSFKEVKTVIETVSMKNEEYLEFFKSIDVFEEEEYNESEEDIKEKLFNKNISLRQFRKLSIKLKTLNFEYKNTTLLLFHHENLKIANYIMNNQRYLFQYGRSPLELNLNIKLFKKYIRCSYMGYEKSAMKHILNNKEKIDIVLNSKKRNIIITNDSLPLDVIEYILDKIIESEIYTLFKTNKKRYDVFKFLIDKGIEFPGNIVVSKEREWDDKIIEYTQYNS